MSKQKKYHFIYKTTCIITNKFYVGMHSTDNLDDGYLGSGKILGYSRNKHGDENHKLEVLEHCSSRDELKQREMEVVNEELLAHPLNMNLKYGGEGGWDHVTLESKQKSAKIASYAMARKLKENKLFADTYSKHMSAIATKRMLDPFYRNKFATPEHQALATAAASCPEAKTKRKATFVERKHQQGEKNSQFGTCWVTNGSKPIKIEKELLNEYLDRGYSRGRRLLIS